MTRDEILSQLDKLIQLDVDATHAYDQAIKNVDDQPINPGVHGFAHFMA